MKIKKRGFVNKIIVFLLLIVAFHCFYLFKYPLWLSNITWIYNWGMVVFSISLLYFVHKYHLKNCWLNKYLLILLGLIIIQFIYTKLNYPNQSFYDTFRVACSFLFIFSSVIFLKYLDNNGEKSLLNLINWFCFLWEILIIVQSFYYRKGVLLFDISSYFYGDSIYERNNNIRMSIGIFAEFMIFYNFTNFFSDKKLFRKNNIKSMVFFVIAIWTLLFVDQGRADAVYIFITLAVIMVTSSYNLKSKVIMVMVTLFAIYIVTSTDLIQAMLETFNSTGLNANSTTHRLYALQYYTECIKNHLFLGNGLLKTTNINDVYYTVEHGSLGWAYYSDVGLIGLTANIGLFGLIIVFIYPLIRTGYFLFKLVKKYSWREYIFPISLYVYLLVSSGTLISTDVQRILQFAFFIAYFEYIYKKDYLSM